MAYRKLVDGDLVRIIGGEWHGFDAVVIDAGESSSRVQVGGADWGQQRAVCFHVRNNHLLIRDEPNGFIVDGRVDTKAQDEYHERLRLITPPYNDDEEDEYSQYEDWTNTDLIDKIISLESKLLKLQQELDGLL
jgi:hypothetical protein